MMAVASGASFTSTSANPGNIVTAGTLCHSNSKAGGTILDVAGLKPGDSASGTVDIDNTGDVAGVFTLSKSNVVDSDTRQPAVGEARPGRRGPRHPDGPELRGSSTTASSAPWAPATWARSPPATAHRYKFTVTFPDGGTPAGPTSGDNAYKGDSVKVDYNWESVSN